MEKKTCVLLGYGNRCQNYSKYALQHPEELEVVGVIDADRDGAVGVIKGTKRVPYIQYNGFFHFFGRDVRAEQSALNHSVSGMSCDGQLGGYPLNVVT